MTQTILVVDDEPEIIRFVRAYLEDAGYRVVTANDGQQALFVARHEKPDLIILDLLMPGMDGWDFIRRYRRERDTPVIMLTARVEETDQVVGLELGADDYVTKPFSPRALVARARAVLRRARGRPIPPAVLRGGDVVLDHEAHTVTIGGQETHLTPAEFNLLQVLMTTPGRVFTRAELLDRVLGDEVHVFERTIDAHVKNLRRKIEPDPAHPRHVITVRGAGYKFDYTPDEETDAQ
ncbi:MAG: response regulator transcription factor [Anaerolineae bacterium]|nr:response regulator transcription factor [Anaerolineae bacterium]